MLPDRSIVARGVSVFVGSVMVVALAGLSAPSASAVPAGAFVQRQGTNLVLDGQPFTFTGINIYNANSDGRCGPAFGSGPALGESLDLIGSGATVIRAWFFQSMATVNGQRDWSAFDHTLSVAASHGERVIPTLANQWPDCEPGSGFKDETWYESGYKQPDPSGTVSYRDFVDEVVTRYRDDPTVLFWQLMNEPEVKPSANSGSCSQNAEGLLESFAADVSGLVKSIDRNHLASLGSIGNGQCGTQGDEYRQVHSIPTIDLCEFHDYDPTAPIPGDQWNGLQVRLDQCGQLDKPLFIGELGMTPAQAGGGLFQRAEVLRTKLRAQFAAGSVGEVLWAWYEAAPVSVDSLDIRRGDPALRVLAGALTPGISSVAAGNWDTCAVTAAGGGKCWGANFLTSLGDHTMIQRNRPVDVIDLPSGVATIDPGSSHTCALLGVGVKCWGENNDGELGQGHTYTYSPTPVDVVGVTGVRALTAQGAFSCALLTGGSAKCWGASGNGQLGGGFPIGSGVYGPSTVATSQPLQQIAAGNSHACAVTVTGGAKCWGSGSQGQVGDGDQFSTSPRATPVDVVGLPSGVIQVAAGSLHSCALTTSGVKCWGARQAGQLGDGHFGQNSFAYTPVDVVGLPDGIQAIASGAHHTCVITPAGGLLCWGDNDYGQLGNDSHSDSAVPVPVTGMSSGVLQVVGGERHTCALKDDGTVWCWGDGQYGQVGNRSTAGSAVPVQVDFTASPTFPLSVTVAGQGSGLVNSSGYELVCTSATCSVDFDQDTVVTLSATPDQGATFAGWSGEGCSGTGTCVVTMDQARSVTATFAQSTRTLQVSKVGSGGGGVISSPPGIDCGGTCQANFASGTPVTLTATPDATSSFDGWSGEGCSGTSTCVVAMDQARSVTATFSSIVADLAVTKNVLPDPASSGNDITYTVQVKNLGPAKAQGVSLSDVLPVGPVFLSFATTQGSCAGAAGTITCNLGSIPNGATATITVVVTPTKTGVISNSVSVSSSSPDSVSSNNQATRSVVVAGSNCTIIGTQGNNIINGTNENDVICGLGGSDTISGSNGNDTLLGGSGVDALSGGSGNDLLFGGAGADSLNGGQGSDFARYDFAPAAVTASLKSLNASGGDGNDTFVAATIEWLGGSAFADTLSGDGANNTIYGLAGQDTLSGLAGTDAITGDAGNDLLLGGDGSDILEGGLGDDTLDGGAGQNRATYYRASGPVTVNLTTRTATGADGNDTFAPNGAASSIVDVQGSLFNDSLAGDDRINQLWGEGGADQMSGLAGGDNLQGAAGNDTLMGGSGNDDLWGGVGDDTLDGGADNDTASYPQASGPVTASLTTRTATGADGNDTFALDGAVSSIENLVGSPFNDRLTGDGRANALSGDAGADALFGLAGDDMMLGGLGNDIFDGGAGTGDSVRFTNSVSAVTASLKSLKSSGGEGSDSFVAGNVEVLIGSPYGDTLTGDDLNNYLYGGSGNDLLYGLDGVDRLFGEAGNDLLDGGKAFDDLDGGPGTDTCTQGPGPAGGTIVNCP